MNMFPSQALALAILIKSSYLQRVGLPLTCPLCKCQKWLPLLKFHLSQQQKIHIHIETGVFIHNDYKTFLNYIIYTIILSLTECLSEV